MHISFVESRFGSSKRLKLLKLAEIRKTKKSSSVKNFFSIYKITQIDSLQKNFETEQNDISACHHLSINTMYTHKPAEYLKI